MDIKRLIMIQFCLVMCRCISIVSQNYCRGCSNADCNMKIPCPPNVPNATQIQCETYGCIWCPLKSFGAKCVHVLV